MGNLTKFKTTPHEDSDQLIGKLINAYDKRGSMLAMAKFFLSRPATLDEVTKQDFLEAINSELGRKM